MAGTDGFEVAPAALVSQAGSLDGVAVAVETGRRAGAQVRLGADAYGPLCQALPGLLHPVHDLLIAAMGDVADTLRGSALALRVAAASYQDFDLDAADALDEVGP